MSINQALSVPRLPAPGEEWPDLRAQVGWNVGYLPKFILLVFCRWLFQESFPGLEWHRDKKTTRIVIRDRNANQGTVEVHKKPMIVTDRGPIKWDNISMSKFLGSNSLAVPVFNSDGVMQGFSTSAQFGGRPGYFIPRDSMPGDETMVDRMSGLVNLHCYAEEGLLAERIASFLFMAIRTHRKLIKRLGLDEVDSASLGRESPVFGTDKSRLVDVTVTVRYEAMVTAMITYIDENFGDCVFDRLRLGVTVAGNCEPCSSGVMPPEDP